MKRILTLLTIATFASCTIFAQDDMYFTPKSKAAKEKERAKRPLKKLRLKTHLVRGVSNGFNFFLKRKVF